MSGLRILLHPNLEALLDKPSMRIVAVQDSTKLSLGVQSEVNYLEADSRAQFGPDYEDVIPFDSLRNMIAMASQRFHYHYVATYHAFNVMRAQFGRSPYPWDKLLDRDEYDRKNAIRPPSHGV